MMMTIVASPVSILKDGFQTISKIGAQCARRS